MPKKKVPNPKKMTIKKKAVPRPPKKMPYVVRFGTRNELGPPKTYLTEPAAKNAIIAAFNEWKPFCDRYNQAGIKIIEASAERVGSIIFHHEPARLECLFDEHTGMHVTVEFWRTS